MSKKLTLIVITCVALITLSIVFKFVFQPLYNKHQLASCISKIDIHIQQVKDRECSDSKQRSLKACLLDAQYSIYCREEAHRTYYKSSGFFLDGYTCHAPDNSEGYWDDNSEYQAKAQECERKNANLICSEVLGNSLDKYEKQYREEQTKLCSNSFIK